MRILANIYAAEVSRILAKIHLKLVSILHSLIYYGEEIIIGYPETNLRDYSNIPLGMLLLKLKNIIIRLSRGNVHIQIEVLKELIRVGYELSNRRTWLEAELRAWFILQSSSLIFVSDISYGESEVLVIQVSIDPRLLACADRELLYCNRHFLIPSFQKRAREIILTVASLNWKSKHASQLDQFKLLEEITLVFYPNWDPMYEDFFNTWVLYVWQHYMPMYELRGVDNTAYVIQDIPLRFFALYDLWHRFLVYIFILYSRYLR